jgi:hypothetical protein
VVNPEPAFDRDSSLFVARGLYVLHYETRSGGPDHPTALVRAAPGSEADIEIISAPGCAAGRLEQPGAALLVRAADHGQLQIAVKRKGSNGLLDAAFRLESVGSLSTGEKREASTRGSVADLTRAPSSETGTVLAASASAAAGFIAHISRRGDVCVTLGQWAGGPEAPGRIEGLELCALGRPGVQAEVQVLGGAKEPQWSEWNGAGAFAGSRGRNQPLLGLRLRLTGDLAHRFVINADALFLGSPILNKRGREVECASHAGQDPLVGLRFEICPERRLSVRPSVALPERDAEQPRVRVFRAAATG